jgi:hypothetical protein
MFFHDCSYPGCDRLFQTITTQEKTMAESVLATHPTSTNGTTNPAKRTSSKDFRRQLGELAQRWQSHDGNDLALRLDTGALLNGFYGDPTRRQARGKGVLKQAAERLRKTEAELCQLRWFAYRFGSVKVLQQRHPGVTNWTQVRDLLAELRQRDRKGDPSTRKAPTTPLSEVTRPLRKLTSAFARLGNELSEKGRTRLVQLLKQFVRAVPDCLKVRLVLKRA